MLTAKQNEFLSWLLDPRESCAEPSKAGTDKCKGTQKQRAVHLKVADSTLNNWKREPEFVSEWQRRITEASGGPERLARHLDTLDRIASLAVDGARAADAITAIRLHAEMVGTYTPKRKLEVSDPRLARASDETLLAKLRRYQEIADAKAKATTDGKR